MKIVTYQIGVDVLGFPVYMEHTVYKGENQSKFYPKPLKWLKCIQKLVKQH